VSGGSLEQLIANKSRELSWPVRIRLACDVAKGLKYVHSRGVMHRDLTSKVCSQLTRFDDSINNGKLCYSVTDLLPLLSELILLLK